MPQTDDKPPAPFPAHTHLKKWRVVPGASHWDWWCPKCDQWVDEDHGISF